MSRLPGLKDGRLRDVGPRRHGALAQALEALNGDGAETRGIIEHIVDPGEFLEVHRSFAENIIVGFGRVEGIVVGIVANQPAVRAGALDMDAADKGARFPGRPALPAMTP